MMLFSVRPKEEIVVSAETEYSAALAETFARIFGRKLYVKKFTYLVHFEEKTLLHILHNFSNTIGVNLR